ncbi:hypothetical protein M3J09_007733 [Ascochyta lentis]
MKSNITEDYPPPHQVPFANRPLAFPSPRTSSLSTSSSSTCAHNYLHRPVSIPTHKMTYHQDKSKLSTS